MTEVDTDGGLVAAPVAVTVQEPGDEGAVNRPDLLIVPHVAVQVTLAVTANCSVPFTTTVGLVGAIERTVTGMLPEPDNVTSCGLPLAESEIVNVAVRGPAALGLKRMPMVQLLDPGRLDPHVLLATEKSAGSVPAIATAPMEIVVVPSICNVTVCAALAEPISIEPKERVCGFKLSVLILPVAVPESDTLCDELNPE